MEETESVKEHFSHTNNENVNLNISKVVDNFLTTFVFNNATNNGVQLHLIDENGNTSSGGLLISTNDFIQYIVYGICIPIIGTVGIIMNVVSLLIWIRLSKKFSINIYLAGLCFFDGFLSLFSLSTFPPLVYCEQSLQCTGGGSPWCQYIQNTARFTYPLMNVAQTGSVWAVTAITVDRFIATTWPFKVRSILTVRRAGATLIGIIIWSFLYNLPVFFELELDEMGALVSSNLRNTDNYVVVYKSYCYLFFMFLIPALTMVCLNGYIVITIRRARHIRHHMTRRRSVKGHRSTSLALTVVLAFLTLNLMANVTNCVEAFAPGNAMFKPLVQMGNLLVTINSATNFVIYCAMSSRFRRKLSVVRRFRFSYRRKLSRKCSMTSSKHSLLNHIQQRIPWYKAIEQSGSSDLQMSSFDRKKNAYL